MGLMPILTIAWSICFISAQPNHSRCSLPCGDKGACKIEESKFQVCKCDKLYTTLNKDEPCAYKQKSKLAAFLISFFAGWFGADYFYLANGSGGYIAAGIFKLLTVGGFGIWWLVDWIRILCDNFADGREADLYPDM